MYLVCTIMILIFCFFFSSRRRHTRSLCDWSSDVCSSDLFESNELLTYSRLLSGVSFIICACGMATVPTSFGCIGSATSYCCTAPPPNKDTYRNLLSYEIRMSAGSEPSASLITRWKASFPSLPTCQCHTLLPNAQLMNPPRAVGPCSQRTSSGDLSRCSTWRTLPVFQSQATTSSPTWSIGVLPALTAWGCAQLDVTIRFSSGLIPTSYM